MNEIEKSKAEASAETAFADQVLVLARNIRVTDAATNDHAAEVCRDVKAHWRRVDEARKAISGPLTNAARNVNAYFSPPLERLKEAEMLLKEQIAAYDRSVQEKQYAAMHAISSGEAAIIPASVETKGVNVRTVRKWRVVDEDAVARQFCSPDLKKIQAHLDAGGLEAIPGVEFYSEEIVSVRQR